MCAPARTGHDMVKSQIAGGAAILALKVVALENVLPGKINALVRGVNIAVQADDRGHWETAGDRPQLVPVGGPDHLAFVEVDQNERALNRADHQRAKILIQYEYALVHPVKDITILWVYQQALTGP